MDSRKVFGNLGEDFACKYLQSKGHYILSRNYSSKWGEIDIISLYHKELFFVEVKSRSRIDMGYPAEAVNRLKMARMNRTAHDYLDKFRGGFDRWSLKIVEVYINEIDYL